MIIDDGQDMNFESIDDYDSMSEYELGISNIKFDSTMWMFYPEMTPRRNSAFEWFKAKAYEHHILLHIFFFQESYEDFIEKLSNNEDFYDEEFPEELPDYVLIRGYNKKLSLFFEERGVKVFNKSKAMFLSRDKYETQLVLEKNHIQLPRLYRTELTVSYKNISDYFESDVFIAKARCGSKGEEVYLIKSEKDFQNLYLNKKNEMGMTGLIFPDHFIFQQYIESSEGRDIRVWVIGGKAIAAVERYNDKSFKSNLAQGGKARKFDLSTTKGREVASMAEKASIALNLDFAGVDLLFNDGGFLLCEVNGNAGFRAAYMTGAGDIPNALMDFVENFHYLAD